MRKVLYIDYDLQVGHVHFNQIQIDALRAQGFDVRLVLHRYMFEHLPYDRSEYDYIFPTCLRYREGRPLLNRIVFLLALLLIRLKVTVNQYDDVVVGYCDEISLWLLPPAKGMYIFMHRTTNVVENSIKRTICKKLSFRHTFLIFNHSMGQMLERVGITSYKIISHGCMPPFVHSNLQIPPHQTFKIFHPSSKLNEDFVTEVLSHPDVLQFLESHHIELILKHRAGVREIQHKSITYLPDRIEGQAYHDAFLEADAILLSYPPTFSGQVSGISYECVSNSKRMLVYLQPALLYCRDLYNYDPVFTSPASFIDLCQQLQTDKHLQCIVSPQQLIPNYKVILND